MTTSIVPITQDELSRFLKLLNLHEKESIAWRRAYAAGLIIDADNGDTQEDADKRRAEIEAKFGGVEFEECEYEGQFCWQVKENEEFNTMRGIGLTKFDAYIQWIFRNLMLVEFQESIRTA